MSEAEIVIVQDVSSGRVHKRFREIGRAELSSFEADNADEAGDVREISQAEFADLPRDARCKRCWPEEAA